MQVNTLKNSSRKSQSEKNLFFFYERNRCKIQRKSQLCDLIMFTFQLFSVSVMNALTKTYKMYWIMNMGSEISVQLCSAQCSMLKIWIKYERWTEHVLLATYVFFRFQFFLLIFCENVTHSKFCLPIQCSLFDVMANVYI